MKENLKLRNIKWGSIVMIVVIKQIMGKVLKLQKYEKKKHVFSESETLKIQVYFGQMFRTSRR
jgi:hypothetical protein